MYESFLSSEMPIKYLTIVFIVDEKCINYNIIKLIYNIFKGFFSLFLVLVKQTYFI